MPAAFLPVLTAIGTAATGVAALATAFRSSNSQPTATPLSEPAAAKTPEVAQREAEDKARRQALAASQRQSTILTSPTGINSGARTVLGG
jgi:hypothetical protein